MLKISRESEINLINVLIDNDIISGKDLVNIKKNSSTNSKQQLPGVGDTPVLGNLFKGKSKTDNLDELLVFIAPRVL